MKQGDPKPMNSERTPKGQLRGKDFHRGVRVLHQNWFPHPRSSVQDRKNLITSDSENQ